VSDTGLDPTIHQRRLRSELRRAREAAGLTQRDVARAMDWPLSKLIRIETGQVGIRTNDLRALLTHYGIADRSRIEALIQLARRSRERSSGHYLSDPEGGRSRRVAYPYEVKEFSSEGGLLTVVLERPYLREAADDEDEPAVSDVVFVEAYLDTADLRAARAVFEALDGLAHILGYEQPVEEEIRYGSIWRRAKAQCH
jgi:transcriptional regulator with XRE-family HTH domain